MAELHPQKIYLFTQLHSEWQKFQNFCHSECNRVNSNLLIFKRMNNRMVLLFLFFRTPSKRYARRTIGGITRNVILDEKNTIDGYRNIPKSQTFSGSSHHSSYHSSFHRYDGTSNHQRATLPHDYKVGNSSQISLHSEKSDE